MRVGFDSINVVDPVYTLPLLIGLFFSLFIYKNKSSRAVHNNVGIVISSLYLLYTLGIKNYVNNHFKTELVEQNITYNSLLTMPVGIANIKWYGVAKTDEGIYMHRYSILEDNKLPFEYFPINEYLLEEINPIAAEKMRWFAKEFYTVVKDGKKVRVYNLQVDMRGIIKNEKINAPTAGYFEITPNADGSYEFGSGAHD